MKIFKSLFFKVLLSDYQWYRKFYGGVWERWWIDVCCSMIWLDVKPPKRYPYYRPPCGYGTPEIEDWRKY